MANRDRDNSPQLSVVVVILAGADYLRRCLGGLAAQVGVSMIDIIVPYDETFERASDIQDEFGDVRFLKLSGRRTYAELRSSGFRHATGDLIALTEDHCTPDPHWCANLLKLHAERHAAVGGSVDKEGPDTALNWAIYLNDFSRYMNPLSEGPASYLTDCNVSYRRDALAKIATLWTDEFHETTVNWALEAQGESLWLSPAVIVNQQRSLTARQAIRERYEFGRLFASTRVAAVGMSRRFFYAVFSLALPAILIARVVRNVLTKRRAVGKLLLSLPWLFVLTTIWAFGEFYGYITATPPHTRNPAPERIHQLNAESGMGHEL